MKVRETQLSGVLEITPEIHGDHRGYFLETYRADSFAEIGITDKFVQDNQSRSNQHTLRGLHYQIQSPQGKLVQVIEGEVFDVAVDLRLSSDTFGQWVGVVLSAEKHNQLWVPPGFAHGFLVLSPSATFVYKCTNFYAPEFERSIRWDDPDIGIEWPIDANAEPLLSHKDKSGKRLKEAQTFP